MVNKPFIVNVTSDLVSFVRFHWVELALKKSPLMITDRNGSSDQDSWTVGLGLSTDLLILRKGWVKAVEQGEIH